MTIPQAEAEVARVRAGIKAGRIVGAGPFDVQTSAPIDQPDLAAGSVLVDADVITMIRAKYKPPAGKVVGLWVSSVTASGETVGISGSILVERDPA